MQLPLHVDEDAQWRTSSDRTESVAAGVCRHHCSTTINGHLFSELETQHNEVPVTLTEKQLHMYRSLTFIDVHYWFVLHSIRGHDIVRLMYFTIL